MLSVAEEMLLGLWQEINRIIIDAIERISTKVLDGGGYKTWLGFM